MYQEAGRLRIRSAGRDDSRRGSRVQRGDRRRSGRREGDVWIADREVRKRRDGEARPALQLPLRADGTFASGPQAIELTSADLATADLLQKRLAPITAPPPKTGSSGALRTIVDAKKLTVAVDSTDQAAVAFGEAFAKALAAAWGVDVEVVNVDAAQAAAGLADKTYDVAVTPADVQPTVTASTVPLFDDGSGRTWNLNVPQDPAFATSLQEFVSADVRSGSYARRYAQTIARRIVYTPAVKTLATR